MIKRSGITLLISFTIFFCIAAFASCSDDPRTPETPDVPDTPELPEPPVADPVFTSLSLNGVEAQLAGNSTYTVKLPYDVDVKSLKLEAETPGVITIDGQVLDADAQLDLTHPVTLTVTTADGKSQSYVLAVRYSDLPVVYADSSAPVTSKDDWVKNGSLSIFTDTADVVALEKVQYKGRGNTTWTYDKKPYAIKLNSKTEILGMPKHKRWVLLANYLDKTLMRNAVAFEIGRCMTDGLGWTPRGQFVDLVFNGEFVGNYYLCEQIKIDKNRVNITEMEATDIDNEGRTGGYLLEYDTYFDEVNKFRTELRNMPVNIKDPDEDVLAPVHLDYIKDYINHLEQVLAGDFTYAEISTLIDVDSFIDWWLVNELVQNYEAVHPKSSYMHKDRNGVLRAGPLWDFDYGTFIGTSQQWIIINSIYYGDLFRNSLFKMKAKERWLSHKPALEALADFIDSTESAISESAEINQKLWPTPDEPNSEGSLNYKGAVNRLRRSYLSRLRWIDSQISAW